MWEKDPLKSISKSAGETKRRIVEIPSPQTRANICRSFPNGMARATWLSNPNSRPCSSWNRGGNQYQTQPTYGDDFEIRIHALMTERQCYHPCPIVAPLTLIWLENYKSIILQHEENKGQKGWHLSKLF